MFSPLTAPQILLLAIASPTYVLLLASQKTGDENTTADLLFTRGLVSLILLEWFADQQQWSQSLHFPFLNPSIPFPFFNQHLLTMR